jgi:hypothetical protein
MRKTLGIVAVLLMLSACSGAPATYLDAVKGHTAQAADDVARNRMGETACKTMRQDNVHAVSDASPSFVRGGMSQEDADAVVRAAVKFLCPDVTSKL